MVEVHIPLKTYNILFLLFLDNIGEDTHCVVKKRMVPPPPFFLLPSWTSRSPPLPPYLELP